MIDLLDSIFDAPTDAVRRADAARHVAALVAAPRIDGRRTVAAAERAVASGEARFDVDVDGFATLRAADRAWGAGRFTTPSVGELRARCTARANGGRLRYVVLDGASPATDIGALQATSGAGTLFQAASQFNCLEAPGERLVAVADYFDDYTQGPRASISAWPATLLRHYAAPAADGTRFTQRAGGPQIELLADAAGPGAAPNGYFTGRGLNAAATVDALEANADRIRVGLHERAEVALGHDWNGVVPPGAPTIAQAFTSTVAGGQYGGERALGPHFDRATRTLLRAAYLGTLLAAIAAGRRRVVLTLIGGGVFANPTVTILDSIDFALAEVESLLAGDLDVALNGYDLGRKLDLNASVLPRVAARGGAIYSFDGRGLYRVRRA